jgi:eukaryotic-like serine/threonine-protein kinase
MLLVGQTFGDFFIEKELGSGAMGSVYRARYTKDGRQVALKMIAMGLAGNENALARFEREANILKQLKHPNITRLFGTGRYKGTPYFAMEYVDGESLDRVMARRGRYSWEEVVTMGKELCAALQHAHEKGIIHRDLKPSNLMVTKAGKVKLTDFGIAKDVDVTALTGANNTIGTAAYMSPEQCKGERHLTAKSDLYSLGIVFYELLTGQKPFVAESPVDMFLLHVNGEPVRPRRLLPELPVWLDTLVMQLMEKNPNHRPLNAAMVADALAEIETKAMNQASIGQEVANARLVDRPSGIKDLDAKDKEAGLAIRAGAKGKKLKKKFVPVYRQAWFVGGLSAIVGLGLVGGLFVATLPPPADKLYAAIQSTEGDAKKAAIERYLGVYGSQTDETTEKVKALDRSIQARERERVLIRRFGKEFLRKNAEEGEDAEAHKKTMDAFAAESEGELLKAANLWRDLAEKYKNEKDREKALWGWVGEKKLRDLNERQQRVDLVLEKIQKAHTDEKDKISDYTSDAVEQKVIECLLLEELGDFPKARERWLKLAEEINLEVDQRLWFVHATLQARELKDKKEPSEATREAFLRAKIEEAKQNLQSKELFYKRLGRNQLRDIRNLYATEISSLAAIAREAEGVLISAK